jgi:ATP-dependent DNA helicase RecQ
LLDRTSGDRPVLKLNDESWKVLRGQREVKIIKPKEKELAQSKADVDSWEGVDRGLFEHLRKWRAGVAAEHSVPPFVIFHDSVLRGLARVRPTMAQALRLVPGIGERKLADFGQRLVELIRSFCAEHRLTTDQTPVAPATAGYVKPKSKNAAKAQAFELFRQGRSLDDVKHKLDRARSTVTDYLQEFIADEKPQSIKPWVSDDVYKRVSAASATSEDRQLTPIFERLDGRVPYDVIRLVLLHLQVTADLDRPK